MVTHKHPHTEAEIREETAPGLPIISAEVYGRESCGESLRLNYIDREHQIQEKKKKTSEALGRMMGWEQRGKDMEVVYARDV